MILEHLTVGVLQTNCYLLGDEQSRAAAVIDPGAEGKRIGARVRELGLDLKAILVTHAHYDHTMAAWTLKHDFGGRIYLNPEDQSHLLQVIFGLAARFRPEVRPVSPDQVDAPLAEGDRLAFGSLQLDVLATPGHTPGHVAFVLRDSNMVFSGDTIFAGAIGRTDLPGGSRSQLIQSVRSKLFTLPEDTIIYPGHGPVTSVGWEQKNNPFFLA
ncbi:MAG: MBL fold metallo-hydrolase [Desulfobacteraceae bacterium]|nr:MBL fold metallo-hydrolase [Desulfobacteraceae bacterium]